MFNYQFIDYNGKKYLVKRIIRESSLKPNFSTEVLKQWTMSDTLLRKDGLYYCCELIQEAEVISWDTQSANTIER